MRRQLSWWIVISIVVMLPLARGGYSLLAEALFIVLAGFALLFSPAAPTRSLWSKISQASWVLWIAWQFFQIAPIPEPVMTTIATSANATWQQNAGLLPSLQPRISLFPAESARFLVSSLGLWCLWETMRTLHATDPRLLRKSLFALTSAGLLQALYGTVAHLGVWSLPLFEPTGHVHTNVAHGTFANRNHYAAYLVLCTAATLALIVAPRSTRSAQLTGSLRRLLAFATSETPVFRTVLFIFVVAIVLTQSRMGNTALGVGLGVFAFAWLLQTRSLRSFAIALAMFSSIIVVDFLIISERFGLEKVVTRIEQTDLDTDARAAARVIGNSMLHLYVPAGAGLGSFAKLEPIHNTRLGSAPFVFAHNDHQQLLIEAGVVGYAILCVLVLAHAMLALQLLNSRLPLRRSIGAATLMATSAAALHSTVEFLAYTPGWRVLFVAILGMVAGLPSPRHSGHLLSMRWGDKSRR